MYSTVKLKILCDKNPFFLQNNLSMSIITKELSKNATKEKNHKNRFAYVNNKCNFPLDISLHGVAK